MEANGIQFDYTTDTIWHCTITLLNTYADEDYYEDKVYIGSIEMSAAQYPQTVYATLWMYQYDLTQKYTRIYVNICLLDIDGEVMPLSVRERAFFIHGPCSHEFIAEKWNRYWEHNGHEIIPPYTSSRSQTTYIH